MTRDALWARTMLRIYGWLTLTLLVVASAVEVLT